MKRRVIFSGVEIKNMLAEAACLALGFKPAQTMAILTDPDSIPDEVEIDIEIAPPEQKIPELRSHNGPPAEPSRERLFTEAEVQEIVNKALARRTPGTSEYYEDREPGN